MVIMMNGEFATVKVQGIGGGGTGKKGKKSSQKFY